MANVIGLTGGFGTGKSSVAMILSRYGAIVVDADKIAADCLKSGSKIYAKVVSRFGKGILNNDLTISRKRLARIVFEDKQALRSINQIIHPEVIRQIRGRIKRAKHKDIVVIDAPLLIEAGLSDLVDILVVVTCPKSIQINRCKRKFKMTKQEVEKRIGNQIPIAKKVRMADFVIYNNGTRNKTKKEVERMWKEITWR